MKTILSLIFIFGSVLGFARGSAVVEVELSPAGSFEIQAKRIKGRLVKTQMGYAADELSVKVSSLKSGISLRDEHIAKRLAGKKILFKKIKARGGKGIGLIVINNIQKKQAFSYRISDNKMKFSFDLLLPTFKIQDIKYMGVGVKDKINIKGSIDLPSSS